MFVIVLVDIWSPGDITNCYGQKVLLNAMCDTYQWVVSVAITGTEASCLARIFMEHVFLKFGFCLMVVIDDNNKFRGILIRCIIPWVSNSMWLTSAIIKR